jgi:hypothetical protein
MLKRHPCSNNTWSANRVNRNWVVLPGKPPMEMMKEKKTDLPGFDAYGLLF